MRIYNLFELITSPPFLVGIMAILIAVYGFIVLRGII